jgi:uncharacterized membrane protein
MESKAKLFGHPIHPMLVTIPLGLFVTGTVFDIVALLTGWRGIAVVSFWNLVVGIGGALLAALFGAVDWWAIPSGTRAKRVGALHGLTNIVVVVLFLTAVLLRGTAPGFVPGGLTLGIEILALALGGVSGWLGGELVDRLGVGVDEGAHLNAPSSLSHRSARDVASSH